MKPDEKNRHKNSSFLKAWFKAMTLKNLFLVLSWGGTEDICPFAGVSGWVKSRDLDNSEEDKLVCREFVWRRDLVSSRIYIEGLSDDGWAFIFEAFNKNRIIKKFLIVLRQLNWPWNKFRPKSFIRMWLK